MSGMKRRFLGLCVPPLLFGAADGTMTLLGQSADYWAGYYGAVNEASPTFNHLLQIHPLAFVGGILVWAVMVVALIMLLPDTPALITSIAVTFGHTVGTATWLLWRFHFGYQALVGLVALSAIVLGLGIGLGWQAAPRQPYTPGGRLLPPAVRWLLVAAIIGATVYLFLWPRKA